MKGITPIIAVILLLLMTVAAGAATMFWFSKLQSAIQTQTETQISQMVGRMAVQFKIIDWYADTNNNYINVTISNIGTSPILKRDLIVKVRKHNLTSDTWEDVCTIYGTEIDLVDTGYKSISAISPGALGIIHIDKNNCPSLSKVYDFETENVEYQITITHSAGFTDTVIIRP